MLLFLAFNFVVIIDSFWTYYIKQKTKDNPQELQTRVRRNWRVRKADATPAWKQG